MPRIEEYAAPITLLRPDREGYSAFETAGRRLGPLYNDVATALREGGAAQGRGIVNAARVAQLIDELAKPVAAVRAGAGAGGGSARDRGNQPTRIADAANNMAGMVSALAKPAPQYQAMMAQGKDRFGSLIGKSLAQGGDTNLRPDLNISDQSSEAVARFQAYNTRERIVGEYNGPGDAPASEYGGYGATPDWGVSAGQPAVVNAAGKETLTWPTTVYAGDPNYPNAHGAVYNFFSGIFGGSGDVGSAAEGGDYGGP